MDSLLKLTGVVLIALTISGVMKQHLPQWSAMLSLVLVMVLCGIVLPQLDWLIGQLKAVSGSIGQQVQVFRIVKIFGVTMLGRICGELSRDSGERALGMCVELGTVIIGVVMAVPLFVEAVGALGGL